MKLITFVFDGSKIVFTSDGWINATQTAKNFGREAKNYLKTYKTQEYIEALKRASAEKEVVRIIKGGQAFAQGSFLHPKLAIDFARWLDASFAIWCDDKISQLLNKGLVSLESKTPAEIILMHAQQLVDLERAQKANAQRIEVLELAKVQAEEELIIISQEPISTMHISVRKALDDLVKAYAVSKGVMPKSVYSSLYKRFSSQYHINLQLKSKRIGISKIQWIEENDWITQAYELAKQLFTI